MIRTISIAALVLALATPASAFDLDAALQQAFDADGPAIVGGVPVGERTDMAVVEGDDSVTFIDETTGTLMVLDPATGIYYEDGTPDELKQPDDDWDDDGIIDHPDFDNCPPDVCEPWPN